MLAIARVFSSLPTVIDHADKLLGCAGDRASAFKDGPAARLPEIAVKLLLIVEDGNGGSVDAKNVPNMDNVGQ